MEVQASPQAGPQGGIHFLIVSVLAWHPVGPPALLLESSAQTPHPGRPPFLSQLHFYKY